MSDTPLSILVFGAHPDDCDLRAGGMAMMWRARGHSVRFVSMTNGDTGHYNQGGGALAKRRYAEAQASGKVADVQYDVLDIHNGELEPCVLIRNMVIRIMREAKADLVLCHRPNDYHPDHRAVGVLVQDAAYVVTVPNVAPLTPHLDRAPVVGYVHDHFKKPLPFEPTVAVDVGGVFDRKVDMAHRHVSQMYEWLPYNGGRLDQIPESDAERRQYLQGIMEARFRRVADSVRDALKKCYGDERGGKVEYAEAVEISEYGRGLSEEEVMVLFPFFG